jgi:hypothetical protein
VRGGSVVTVNSAVVGDGRRMRSRGLVVIIAAAADAQVVWGRFFFSFLVQSMLTDLP